MATPAQAPTLAQAIRSKYPGVYDDLSDTALEQKVLAKYPQYGDMPRTQPEGVPGGEIKAAPTGVLPWLNNLESDIRYGSNSTAIGQFLHKIGMQATTAGAGAADETLASPITGPLHAAQGVAQLPSSPLQGAKKIASGVLETGAIPGAFLAPEGAEAASKAPGFIKGLFPSAERAGSNFQKVMGAAKDFPVHTSDELSTALSKYQDLVNRGGSRSVSVGKLLNRITDPSRGPLTYEEARDFYSNISRLSADESNRLTPVIKRQVGAIKEALGNSIQSTATTAGKGAEYSGAMKEYAKAKKLEDFTDMLKGQAVNAAKYGVPTAIGGTAAGYVAKKILKTKP